MQCVRAARGNISPKRDSRVEKINIEKMIALKQCMSNYYQKVSNVDDLAVFHTVDWHSLKTVNI